MIVALAKITLIGMYQWMSEHNDPLFKNLSVPTGMDKDQLINAILYKGAEFGVLCADPHFMQSMIKIWSDRYHHTLERWVNALSIDYDPLENYDRREDWIDNGVRSRTGKSSLSGSEVGTESKDNTENSADVRTSTTSEASSNHNNVSQTTADVKTGNQTDDHKVSAFDSTAYQNKDKTEMNSGNTDTTVTSTGSAGDSDINGSINDVSSRQASDKLFGSDSRIRNENKDDSESEDHSSVHTGRTHGNIGVTTSQQMLQAELDIARFNLYDEAADLFLSEFCIYVY